MLLPSICVRSAWASLNGKLLNWNNNYRNNDPQCRIEPDRNPSVSSTGTSLWERTAKSAVHNISSIPLPTPAFCSASGLFFPRRQTQASVRNAYAFLSRMYDLPTTICFVRSNEITFFGKLLLVWIRQFAYLSSHLLSPEKNTCEPFIERRFRQWWTS